MEGWDSAQPDEDSKHWRERMLSELTGETCYAGLDIASRSDITALVLWFPERKIVLPWFWVPEAQVTNRKNNPSNQGRFYQWVADGFMNQLPGFYIDQNNLYEDICRISQQFNLVEISYDPWNAEALRQRLELFGISMIEFQQSIRNFNEPTKEFLRMANGGLIQHGGNPVLRWMATNLMAREDSSGNLRPDKQKSGDKIDGIVAAIMAVGRAETAQQAVCYYEHNDVEAF
jgi:phage terminase large subunit-like protein